VAGGRAPSASRFCLPGRDLLLPFLLAPRVAQALALSFFSFFFAPWMFGVPRSLRLCFLHRVGAFEFSRSKWRSQTHAPFAHGAKSAAPSGATSKTERQSTSPSTAAVVSSGFMQCQAQPNPILGGPLARVGLPPEDGGLEARLGLGPSDDTTPISKRISADCFTAIGKMVIP
jgi:hypothetical protein